jgi:hypothetical protein
MSEHEHVPEELAELFAAERAAPGADAATRAAARSRLAAAIAHLPLGKAAALGGAGKLLVVLAIAVAAGTGTVALLKSDERATPRPPTPVPAAIVTEREERVAPPPAPESEQTPEPIAIPSPARSAKPERVTRSERTPPAPQQAPTAPPSQAQLLRRAWALVSSGQPAEALELVRNDQQLHPDGVLAEERDALTVHALVKLQRIDEARAAAAGFIVKYPNSVHRAQVELAVKEQP